jgi:oligopeptide/dipeptide ABC transporter ATP-binding protein
MLQVRNLSTFFDIKKGLLFEKVISRIRAVDTVSFDLHRGETLGIVGESGSGKSTLARTLLRLVPHESGHVFYQGQDLLTLSPKAFRPYRRDLQIVFQDPESSLNPKMNVFEIVSEGATNFRLFRSKKQLEAKVGQIFEKVGLPARAIHRYPHEFSGGQKQRIGIARALMMTPKILIADEPVSALDLSIQAQILKLFREVQQAFALTLMFVAHNLAVVRNVSNRIVVMYLGKIMEIAPAKELFQTPRHPYTLALIASALPHHPEAIRKRTFVTLKGEIPSPASPPSGCVFRTRCPLAQDLCARVTPPLEEGPSGHLTACHFKQN